MDEDLKKEFEEFLKNIKRLQPRTIKEYSNYLRRMDEQYPTQENINKFMKKVGNSNPVRAMIKSYIEFLEYSGEQPFNIKITKPSGSKKERIVYPLSIDEINKLRNYFNTRLKRERFIFEIIYQGALRRSELTGIKINSFNWLKWIDNNDDFLELNIIGKRNKQRIVLVDNELAEEIFKEIKDYLGLPDDNDLIREALEKNDEIVFPELNSRKIYYIISDLTKKYFNKRIRPHQLRHTKANDLLDNGVNINDIKNYLGHKSIATTEIYLHKSIQDSIDNIKKKQSLQT